mmetsp:Transcript_1771/g.4549  ORF Transcript_1771/g.4549 Transcript_1771/m.4549 type:complete len:283 (-) Transcript_1771:490-1338(-)
MIPPVTCHMSSSKSALTATHAAAASKRCARPISCRYFLAAASVRSVSNLNFLNDGFGVVPFHTHVHSFTASSPSGVSSSYSGSAPFSPSTCAFQSMRRIMSFSYRRTDLTPPSTMTMQKDSVMRHTPDSLFSCALMSTLNLFFGLARDSTLYTCTCVSTLPVGSSKSLRIFRSRRSAGVSCLAKFRSSCADALSSICCRTSFSIAVGSAVASSVSTRIRLEILTFGFGGSNKPWRIISCFSCSRCCRRCVRSFFCSRFVSFRGCGGGGGASIGGCIGTGCST